MKEDGPENHDAIPPEEWRHTVQLIDILAVLDRWLWAEKSAEAEIAEKQLSAAQKHVANSSEYIANKNAEYFEGLSRPFDFQIALRTTRYWADILDAGAKAAFPDLDFLQLVRIGGVFDLRENIESLLLLAYLRHVFTNRKCLEQDQATEREPRRALREPGAGDDIFDMVLIGLSPDALATAIKSAAKGLKTLVIDDGRENGYGRIRHA